MTKTSKKIIQKVKKSKQSSQRLKTQKINENKHISRKRLIKNSFLRSKSETKRQTRQTIQEQECKQLKFQENISDYLIESMHGQEDFGLKLNVKSSDEYIKKRERKKIQKMFYSDKYETIKEQDLLIYLKTLANLKISGVIIANEYGKILYSDKMGHELFQGSLNKFGSINVQNLLLKATRDQNLQQLKQIKIYNENTIFKWFIYSKNNKRRYSKVPFDSNKNSLDDIYYRFLKCLTIRVRPIKINIKRYNLFQGIWNHQNLHQQSENQCFMLQIKHSNQISNLYQQDLLKDPIIQKYIQCNTKKVQRLQSQGKLSFSALSQKNSFNCQESMSNIYDLSMSKKVEENSSYHENKYKRRETKGSKQEDKKNTSLKQPYGICLITEIFFDEE